MMIRAFSVTSATILAALLTSACAFDHQSDVLAPTNVNTTTTNAGGGASNSSGGSSQTPPMTGYWVSAAPELPDPSTCTNFTWQVTSQTSNSVSGTFSATCGGGLKIEGEASGQLNGNSVPITAKGTASLPGIPSCDFTLSGTGTIDGGTTLTMPYTGTTCLGPVHGTQVLRKRSDPPPPAPAPPAPAPTPTPAPGPDPLLGCGPLAGGEKIKLVECIHDAVNPGQTVEGAFEVTKRVAWALRGEGAGLLIKNGGENIVSWQGYSFAAARICYPDGHIFKILTDVPTTNGPSWQDNDFVDTGLYVPAIDPLR